MDVSTLKELSPVVAISVVWATALYFMQKGVVASHKDKSLEQTKELQRKDDLIKQMFDTTTELIKSVTQSNDKLSNVVEKNTAAINALYALITKKNKTK